MARKTAEVADDGVDYGEAWNGVLNRTVESLNGARVPVYDSLLKRALKTERKRSATVSNENEAARDLCSRYIATLARTWKGIVEMHVGVLS